ncbi:MAG: nicotinate-nucleotide adenylyltransferase [Gemmatimonadetes bacterium]|nr:nicotinate-nucleotide adenylyltransferase [Gemmatimonadota bacterium]
MGLFGGTFDPPHAGHLIAAQDAIASLGLDRVVFIPAAVPPHKREHALTPAEVRAAMVKAAIAGDARFALDDIELQRSGPSYTVDTLIAYGSRHPGASLFLLMGVDQYAEMHTWRRPDEIRRLATLAVLDRAGEPVTPGPGVVRVPVTRIDISSTGIRERVRQRRPIRYLVPDAVGALIDAQRLYR